MKLSEFIAEIKSSMKSYDSANLIDEISIQNWVTDELKRFGANIMDLQDEVLHVKNGRVSLPLNYWHLRLAVRCYPESFKNLDGDDEDVRYSRALNDRIERGASWLPSGECKEITERTITEKIYIDNKRVELRYSTPELLTVTKGVMRKKDEYACLNLDWADKIANQGGQHTIVINNRTLQTNFREGVIYAQYYGLLSDEDGEVIIPETQHNRLKTYLEYHVKSKILEDMILNNDDRSLVNLLQYFDSKAQNQFALAQTEAKFEALNWRETKVLMRNKNKRGMRKFESMFPSI